MTDTHTQPLLLDGQGCKPIHPLRNNIPYIFQITAVQCTSEPGDQLYNGQQDILVQPGFSFVPPLNRERELGMITLAVTCSHHHCHCCQPPEIFSQENLHTVLFLHTFLVAQQLKANKLNFIKVLRNSCTDPYLFLFVYLFSRSLTVSCFPSTAVGVASLYFCTVITAALLTANSDLHLKLTFLI